jgi:hypothetical protein
MPQIVKLFTLFKAVCRRRQSRRAGRSSPTA